VSHAIKLEAYQHSQNVRAAISSDHEGGRGKQEDNADNDDNASILKHIEQLEKVLEWAAKGTGAACGSSSKRTGSRK